jgi:DNA-binding NarL/FixJ family response regulator
MSQWGVQLVIGKLLTDDTFRQRFESGGHDTLARLCEQGVELSDVEVAALLDTDPQTWAAVAARIDRRLQINRPTRTDKAASWKSYTSLTTRQRQVLRGIFQGLTNRQIGLEIGVSESSVKATLQHLFRKTHVRSRTQLVRTVMEGSPGSPPDRLGRKRARSAV